MNDTPRFGIFNDSFPPIIDGVTLTVENYVKWLSAKGHECSVITPWNPEKGEYPYEVIRYFSTPIHSRKPYRYGYPKLDPFIWRRLRNTPFRLCHSHCPFSSGRLAVYVKKKQNVPLIGTFHSKYREDLKHSFRHAPWMVTIIMKRILNFFNACDEVWIPQAEVEETVREYGYKGHLEVVDNGIDYADRVSAADLGAVKAGSRKKLGIAPDELSLLFVGQHIREKGILLIADALNLLKDKLKFRMNFVGDGYALPELRERIKGYGLEERVRINGMVSNREDLVDYYAAGDLFLFPSYYDNAPLVLREAAAMGTPGILVNGSTASEVIRPGINGYLADSTPAEYARLIEKLASDRASLAAVGLKAKETLVRSWEDVVDEVYDRYVTILKNYK